jgi:hypothetical protein
MEGVPAESSGETESAGGAGGEEVSGYLEKLEKLAR